MKKIKKVMSLMLVSMMTVTPLTSFAYEPDRGPNESVAYDYEAPVDLNRKIVGYFPEWAYKSQEHNYFNVTDLQWEDLTHIQYSFAMVDPATNKIAFGDKHAAVEETFEGMDLSYGGKPITLDPNLSYQGHFNVLQQMKKQFPDVKLLISVGGWAGSRGFYTMMDTDKGIDTFVNSCVDFIRTYGFDGVDIDFEYPSSTSQSGNPEDFDVSEPRRKTINARYNVMMQKLREALDQAGKEDGKHYLQTAAVTASSWVLGGVESNEYAKYLDFLSIMSYDYHGGWNEFVENQANLYPDPADRETINMLMPVLGMDWSYKYYRGILPPEKILMGIPYYTRGWENVQGGNGTGLHGTSRTPATGKYNLWGDYDAAGYQIPAGANPLWHVLNLMEEDPNLQVHWDSVGKVPYVWQNNEKVFLSFENEQSIDARLDYIEEKNLGGALIWVMDGDYGLSPNYVPGSTHVNEGKYTYGDTLTNRLSKGLDKMGPAKKTDEGVSGLQDIGVDVTLKGVYDHPNYTYTFNVTNYTDEVIKGGWELAFDLPKSAKFKSPWGGTVTEHDNGDFTRITITAPGWQNLDPGATTQLQGMIGLCFGGIQNVTFNGMNPVGKNSEPINKAPALHGIADATLEVGQAFDPMAGVTATDEEDGDLTSAIQVSGTVQTEVAGVYELIYTVSDKEGLVTTQTRTVTVKEVVVPENTAPVLHGITDATLEVGQTFDSMASVTAIDEEDGDLTSAIQVSGTVQTEVAGVYELIYTVSDKEGLVATQTRTVTVKEVVVPENTAPVLHGITDTTLEVGQTFDPMAGVTATDEEDGDLTSVIQVSGTVQTQVAGVYDLTYTVSDKEGLETVASRKVVVKEVVQPEPDGTYDPNKIYVAGDTVSYNGKTYRAKWWTQGIAPGKGDVWELQVPVNPDGSVDYIPGKAYVQGDVVSYNGQKYAAKWWTTSIPGSDESWELVK